MDNRQRYIIKSNEHDLMMRIRQSAQIPLCPIRAIMGEFPSINTCKALPEDCSPCIQKWLNQEDEK